MLSRIKRYRWAVVAGIAVIAILGGAMRLGLVSPDFGGQASLSVGGVTGLTGTPEPSASVASGYTAWLLVEGIPGASTTKRGNIDLTGYSWRESTPPGGGKVTFEAFEFEAATGSASPLLAGALYSNTAIPTATLTVRNPTAGDFLTWTLSNVNVTAFKSSSGLDSFALTAGKFEVTYRILNASGGETAVFTASAPLGGWCQMDPPGNIFA
ncbi:MAG: type VI secretion system tube protein Hcp [Dehalococcoidia bacterium]|nr:type VI secretion system tube protein Hcp [Dehalococcoidia bacterium]